MPHGQRFWVDGQWVRAILAPQLALAHPTEFYTAPSLSLFHPHMRSFTMLVADCTSARSIVAFKHDEDKVRSPPSLLRLPAHCLGARPAAGPPP